MDHFALSRKKTWLRKLWPPLFLCLAPSPSLSPEETATERLACVLPDGVAILVPHLHCIGTTLGDLESLYKIELKEIYFGAFFKNPCTGGILKKFVDSVLQRSCMGCEPIFAPKEACHLIPFSVNLLKYPYVTLGCVFLKLE